MSAIVVYHASFGCDTGCCGHRIEMDGESPPGGFWEGYTFSHPYDSKDARQWAEEWVTDVYGAEHVKDLDWENCLVLDD